MRCTRRKSTHTQANKACPTSQEGTTKILPTFLPLYDKSRRRYLFCFKTGATDPIFLFSISLASQQIILQQKAT